MQQVENLTSSFAEEDEKGEAGTCYNCGEQCEIGKDVCKECSETEEYAIRN